MTQKRSTTGERLERDEEAVSQMPYVFIVGCTRSGTTLLKRMVDAHPQIAITRESHWIPRYYLKCIDQTPEAIMTREFTDELLKNRGFRKFGISREEIDNLFERQSTIYYANFVSSLFVMYARQQGKPLAGSKTPSSVRYLSMLHELWPEARFVHLIRDGRDICLSYLNWPKSEKNMRGVSSCKEDPVSTIAARWSWYVQQGREASRSLGPDLYYEVRYEALVQNPAEECAKLCSFLRLPFDDGMVRFHEGRTRTEPGLSTKHAWLPPTPGLRDWRSQMPSEDIECFEAAAGDLLEELGYDRAHSHPRQDALTHASRIREIFIRDHVRKKPRLT